MDLAELAPGVAPKMPYYEGMRRHGVIDEAAIVRLVGALLLEQNDEWQLNRRYMQLEGLQSLAGNSPARLSAVAQ